MSNERSPRLVSSMTTGTSCTLPGARTLRCSNPLRASWRIPLRGAVFFAVGFLGPVFGVASPCFLPPRLRLPRLPQRRLLRPNRTGHGITSSTTA